MKNRFLLALSVIMFSALAACSVASAPINPDEEITLIIRFEASEEGVSEFEEIMAGVAGAMASEPGFQAATVHRNIDQPNVFVLEEVWASRALHEEHFDTINRSGDWSHIRSLLVREPEMGYYQSR
ncbi:MAG: antibiotic biosynthesis monooxygenase family protein [Pseudomonadota bacterium]